MICGLGAPSRDQDSSSSSVVLVAEDTEQVLHFSSNGGTDAVPYSDSRSSSFLRGSVGMRGPT
jgi:hypothetical protein